MCKVSVIIVALLYTSINCINSQAVLFHNLKDHFDMEYEELVKANEEGNWLTEKDLQGLKYLIDYYYSPKLLLYEVLADQGRPKYDDRFELIFFTFYRYEFPAFPWCRAVYKHKNLDIYIYVSFDILNHNGEGFGRIISCRYYDEFMKEFEFDYGFDEDYWNFMNELNFSGFAAWFEAEEITRVRFLHSQKDFGQFQKVSDRLRSLNRHR